MTQPHILVVDDDERLRALLGKFLRENDFLVTTAADAASARQHLDYLSPDLLVLDVMMPGETGFEFIAWLRQRSHLPVLLLTARGEPTDRIAGLEAGADDYLAKPFEPKELLLRANAILRRMPQVKTENTTKLGRWVFYPGRGELLSTDGADRQHLTEGELAILRMLASQPGRPVSREQLTRGEVVQGQDRAVDVQINRLRRKLDDDARQPRYLQTVRGEGYVLWPDA